MGRKTYESIGKPLPGRKNIVITRKEEYKDEGITVVHDMHQALREAEGADEAFVIGGAEIYKEAMPLAQKLYLTKVEGDFGGDTFFPEVDSLVWEEISRKKGIVDEKNKYPHTFYIFERKKS